MEILPYLNQYANLILVGITFVYATLTWMMLREMRKARKAELRSCIKASLESYSNSAIVLKIQNIGKGAAIGVDVEYALKLFEDVKSVWKYPLLISGDAKKIYLPELNKERTAMLKEAIEKYKEVIVKIDYKDVFNERYEKIFHINLKEFEEGLSGTLKEPSIEENITGLETMLGILKKILTCYQQALRKSPIK